MAIYEFYCPRCDDEWSYAHPGTPRETCIDCGSRLEVEEVTA